MNREVVFKINFKNDSKKPQVTRNETEIPCRYKYGIICHRSFCYAFGLVPPCPYYPQKFQKERNPERMQQGEFEDSGCQKTEKELIEK